MAGASLWAYRNVQVPSVPLPYALAIGQHIVDTAFAGKPYVVGAAKLYGDEKDDDAGAWNLLMSDPEGNRLHVVIYFPQDLCNAEFIPKQEESQGIWKLPPQKSQEFWLHRNGEPHKEVMAQIQQMLDEDAAMQKQFGTPQDPSTLAPGQDPFVPLEEK